MNNLKYITSCLVLFFLLLSEGIQAQFYIEFNTGYAAAMYFPDYNRFENRLPSTYTNFNSIENIDTTTYVCNRFNMGNGMLFSTEFGFAFTEKFEVSLNSQYINNKDIRFFYKPFIQEQNTESFYEEEGCSSQYNLNVSNAYYGRRLSFTPKISYNIIHSDKLKFQAGLGISLSYLKLFKESNKDFHIVESSYNYSGERIEKEKQFISYSKNNRINSYISLAVYYKLNPKLEIKICSEYNSFLVGKFSGGTQYYYSRYYEVDGEVIEDIEDNKLVSNQSLIEQYANFNALNVLVGLKVNLGVKN